MVVENAAEGIEQLKLREAERGDVDAAMEELQEALSLPDPPRRLECYDISNIQGTNAVGQHGGVRGRASRRAPTTVSFRIKAGDGPDDYSMMREVLTRRFRRLAENASADNGGGSKEEAWQTVPDLVLIDGGKGHLSAALQVFLELGIERIPLASLAKENEELFVPQVQEPISTAALVTGAVPGAARAGRGAPVRRHLPSPAQVEEERRLRDGRGRGDRAEAPPDAAAPVRLRQGR